jgi:syntaxin 1B/2/3
MSQYSRLIEKIKTCSNKMSRDVSVNRNELRILHASAQEANTFANKINKALEDFGTHYRRGTLTNIEMEERARKHQKLMNDSAALQKRFDKELKRALRAEKQINEKRSIEKNAYAIEGDDDEEQQQQLVQYVGQQELESEITFCEALLEEREKGIESLQKQMVEVAQMFQDLQTIIMESRAGVETIEENISNSHQQAQKGLQHIRKSDQYQSSTRKTLMCTFLCLLVFLGSMLLYFILLDGTSRSRR